MIETSDIRNQKQEIILCPGQGAQHVGMGSAWARRFAVAAETFKTADRILGLPLDDLCFNGPEENLNRTDIAQAAIYATSVACHRALKEQGQLGPLAAVAGLSLGEFTALHLAGAFDFESGLRLVRQRGQFMQEAAESSQGSMVALVGADEAQARQVCQQALDKAGPGNVLVPANFNCPGQIVISGSLPACQKAVEVATELGVRSQPLKVAGAFHSPLMQPAADRLAAALEQVAWNRPAATVYANVTALPHDSDNLGSIKGRLVEQLTSPVRWDQSMAHLAKAIPGARWVELAPGKVLMGLMRRIDRNVKIENFAEPAE